MKFGRTNIMTLMQMNKIQKSWNVCDKYREDVLTDWTVELVKNDLKKNSFPYAVLMENFLGDFTIGSVLRSCNALGGSEMYYYGKKKYDRRSTVGTHHYTGMNHISSVKELVDLKKKYVFVALENNISNCQPIYDYEWDDNSLIIVGEEGKGVTPETLKICDKFIFIPQYGSVRSMNAAVAASIAMNDYVSKFLRKRKS
jgi:tRNA G18 (ribose-2'-O)-methylase SpoU